MVQSWVSDAHLCYEPAQCLVVARIGVDVRANVADINFSESVVANQMSHAVRKSESYHSFLATLPWPQT